MWIISSEITLRNLAKGGDILNDQPTKAVFVAPPPEEEIKLVETGRVSYVRLMYPSGNGLGPENKLRVVNHRDPKKIEAPIGCIGFFFFEQTAEGSGGFENISVGYYFGKRFTLAERKAAKLPGDQELFNDAVYADTDEFVQTRYGNFRPICHSDVVLEDPHPVQMITDKLETDEE